MKVEESGGGEGNSGGGLQQVEVKEELEGMSMEELQEELGLEEAPEKFHPKHVMTALGQRWKALSDEERAEWIEQATSEEGEE